MIPGDSLETIVITMLIAPLGWRSEGILPPPSVKMSLHPVPEKIITFIKFIVFTNLASFGKFDKFGKFGKFGKFARCPQFPGALVAVAGWYTSLCPATHPRGR